MVVGMRCCEITFSRLKLRRCKKISIVNNLIVIYRIKYSRIKNCYQGNTDKKFGVKELVIYLKRGV